MKKRFALTERPANLPPAPDAMWDWMEKKELNQRQAAKVLGWPYVTLNGYLHARKRPGLARIQRLFEVMGIPMALWLETRASQRGKRRLTDRQSTQCLPTGN